MVKKRELNSPERENIIKLSKQLSSYKIAEMLDLKRSSVSSIIQKFTTTGSFHTLPRTGRPRILNLRQERTVLKDIRNDQFSSVNKIAKELNLSLDDKIFGDFFCRILHRDDYKDVKALKDFGDRHLS